MKKINHFKLLTASLLLASLLVSCSADPTGGDMGVADTSAPPKQSTTEDNAVAPPDLEAKDYGGRDFTILSREKGTTGFIFPFDEVLAEEQSGELINDAVYKRNMAIEEKYNINIVALTAPMFKVGEAANTAALAGDALYDVVMPSISEAFTLAVNGTILDIDAYPHLDFTKPWWMSSMLSDTSVLNHNYFIPSDINIGTMNTVGITYFNKKLLTDHALEDPYTLVEDGKWTLDKLSEMAKGITSDLDGNGTYDENDKYGLECSSFAWQPFFYGTDNLIIKKDDKDSPYLDASNERVISAIQKVIGLLNDKKTTLNVNHLKGIPDLGALTIQIFNEGRALFYVELLYGVPQLRNMDNDFGILPMPKLDENQTDYTAYVHTSHSSVVTIPITNEEPDMTGRILEDMAYQSYISIRPTYYDIMLKTKFARDNESGAMLDIIYENIRVDLTLAMIDYGLDIDSRMRTAGTENKTDIMSTIISREDVYAGVIKKVVDSFEG